MRKIEGKKRVFWKIVLQRLCWKTNDIMKFIRDHCFCYYEVDREEVRKKVAETNNKAERFNKVEEKLPDIYAALTELRHLRAFNKELVDNNKLMRNYFVRLYVADLCGDCIETKKIYEELFKKNIIKENWCENK